MDELVYIGKNVAKLRKQNKWTTRELAERVGCSNATISQIENNKRSPSFEMLLKLAEAFKCSTAALTMDEETNVNEELAYLFEMLTDDEKADVLQYANFLIARRNANV